jgi:hypothetical protein
MNVRCLAMVHNTTHHCTEADFRYGSKAGLPVAAVENCFSSRADVGVVRATVVRDPSVAAGMGLSLTGTTQFDQTFDIDTVHHDFGMRGHTTHITARAAKKGRKAS